MPRAVELTHRAARDLKKLSPSVQIRFKEAIDRLAAAPNLGSSGLDLRRLSGTTDLYRVRVGDYRAIFAARENSIVFLRFGHRSSIYRPV